jgi:hypothetical protein
MEPLNSAERKSSFFLFLLFFIISIILLIAAVFYGVQVPFKQNELMKRQIADYQKEQLILKKFSDKMSETKEMLEKINKPGVDQPELIDSKIQANLDAMNLQLGLDSSLNTKTYQDIISSLLSLKSAKKDLRENGKNDEDKAQLKQDLKDAKDQINQLQSANDNLRRSNH